MFGARVATDEGDAVGAAMERLGVGTFAEPAASVPTRRNDNWFGGTTAGRRVFVKRIGTSESPPEPRRFSRNARLGGRRWTAGTGYVTCLRCVLCRPFSWRHRDRSCTATSPRPVVLRRPDLGGRCRDRPARAAAPPTESPAVRMPIPMERAWPARFSVLPRQGRSGRGPGVVGAPGPGWRSHAGHGTARPGRRAARRTPSRRCGVSSR